MIMMLATPIAPTRRATAPKAKEQGAEGALCLGACGEDVRGAGDGDLAGVFRVGLFAKQGVDARDDGLGVGGANVDLRWVAVEMQVLFGGGEANQDCGVDFGGVAVGIEDAGDIEPLAAGTARADPDPHPGPDPVDAQQLGGLRAEHYDGLAGGQAERRGVHADGVGLDRGDEWGLVSVDAVDGAGVLDVGDAGQPVDHARRGHRQFRGGAAECLPVGDGQQVGAQAGDLGQQPLLGGGG
jgi:hypothetical protein